VRNSFYGALLLIAFSVGFLVARHLHPRDVIPARRVLYYVDPMHPAYKSEKPGIAPDCGMQLEPVYSDEIVKSAVATQPVRVAMDLKRQQSGIQIVPVSKMPGTAAEHLVGRVAIDETRSYRVNLGVDGFVRETYNDAVGSRVRKNQRLASVYSPEFLRVEGAYIAAADRGSLAAVKEVTQAPEFTGNRLRNLGMSESQLKELIRTRRISEDISVVSPVDGFIVSRNISAGQKFERYTDFYRIADLTQVWIVVDLFGDESQYFHSGAVVRVTPTGYKHSLWARVSNALPREDPATRAFQVRLEVDNPQFALRPDMLVRLDLPVQIPPGLSVPWDALLDFGLKKAVFIDKGSGLLEAREVETGSRFGERVQIRRGLAEGEKVATPAAFLVDSESRFESSR
jgi:membrane fusion protein, copper/silver efflux system